MFLRIWCEQDRSWWHQVLTWFRYESHHHLCLQSQLATWLFDVLQQHKLNCWLLFRMNMSGLPLVRMFWLSLQNFHQFDKNLCLRHVFFEILFPQLKSPYSKIVLWSEKWPNVALQLLSSRFYRIYDLKILEFLHLFQFLSSQCILDLNGDVNLAVSECWWT